MTDVRRFRTWLFAGVGLIVVGLVVHVLGGDSADLLWLLCNTAGAVAVVVASVQYLRRPR